MAEVVVRTANVMPAEEKVYVRMLSAIARQANIEASLAVSVKARPDNPDEAEVLVNPVTIRPDGPHFDAKLNHLCDALYCEARDIYSRLQYNRERRM